MSRSRGNTIEHFDDAAELGQRRRRFAAAPARRTPEDVLDDPWLGIDCFA